jgi:hypothetical protein
VGSIAIPSIVGRPILDFGFKTWNIFFPRRIQTNLILNQYNQQSFLQNFIISSSFFCIHAHVHMFIGLDFTNIHFGPIEQIWTNYWTCIKRVNWFVIFKHLSVVTFFVEIEKHMIYKNL